MAECPSRFTIVQFKTDDLEETECRTVSDHLQTCNSCQKIVAELEQSRAVYQSRQEEHLAVLRARINHEQQQADPGPFWYKLAAAFGTLAAVSVVVLVMVPHLDSPESVPQETEPAQTWIQAKGAMAFRVIAKRGEHQFQVEPGAELQADDAVRFIVNLGSSGYLSVFSIDSAARVSPFYPDSDPTLEPAPMELKSDGRHELPGSIVLDRSRGNECLVVAFSDKPFDRSEAHERARRSDWFKQKSRPEEEEAGTGVRFGVLWVKKRE